MSSADDTAVPTGPALRRRASWKLKLAAVCTGCVIAALVGEGALRLCGFPRVGRYSPDLNLGARLVQNYGGWQRAEGEVYVRTSSAGWRDREHTLQAAPNTFRIAVLGDSFSEAAQVEIHEAYWAVLERELAGREALQGRQIEVLNFGVSGYGTTQEFLCLEHEVWQYKPDLILLQFLPGNDVCNNSHTLEPDRGRPFHVFSGDELMLDNTFREQITRVLRPGAIARNWDEKVILWKHFLISHSAIMSLIYEMRHRNEDQAGNLEPGIESLVFFEPGEPEWIEAWAITDAVLREMQESCREHQVPLVVFTANNSLQVHPDDAFIRQIARENDATDVLYPDEHLQTLAEATGFRFISLTLPMREIAQRDGTWFHGFPNTAPGAGHWNVTGHATAGKLLTKELCRLLDNKASGAD